jgi:predicted nucleotidyltransferase
METSAILQEMERTYGEVHGACLYGSQVCGYATGDSDYDVLVVLEDYGPGVKYTYVQNGMEMAFLGVDREVFEEDVRGAAYGGFIADRLLNPIIPLVKEEYIRASEVERKKAVVEWETAKLVLKNREAAGYLDINILYYPYKKWNKMAAVYHPYRYSIENTLRKDLKEKNLASLLPGFEKAIRDLGILREVYPGWYRIEESFVSSTLDRPLPARLERIKMAEREMEDVVARYLTHKKAGDSDRDLVIREIISKVRREVRHLREHGLSSPLEDPEKFLIYPK